MINFFKNFHLQVLHDKKEISLGILVFLVLGLNAALYLTKQVQRLPKSAQEKIAVKAIKPSDFVKIVPLQINNPVYSFKISGEVVFQKPYSFVRVVLIDKNNNEYLIFESYPLVAESDSFSVSNICEETCVLSSVTPVALRIEGNSASFTQKGTTFSKTLSEASLNALSYGILNEQQRIKAEKEKVRIDKLNKGIKSKGEKWIAKETSVSKLSYSQKRKLFLSYDGQNDQRSDHLPNLQGFEYYGGGIFTIKSEEVFSPPRLGEAGPQPVNLYPKSWDWRNRHGENWLTSVRNQAGCGSCWAFAATGVTEAVANLYFNQHLDIDLAEMDVLSCSGGGSCSRGGYVIDALNYYQNAGVVTEACFPYVASDQSCLKCPHWQDEVTKITGWDYYYYGDSDKESWAKEKLVKKGVMTGGIYSWWHVMDLVGWETDKDNSVVWIFKNSWGTYWGESGYARVKVAADDFDFLGAVIAPVTIANRQPQIACVDKDGDEYCNWGIAKGKPATCPSFCKPEKDCDDSNAELGSFDANFNCTVTPIPTSTSTPTPTPIPTSCSIAISQTGFSGSGTPLINDYNTTQYKGSPQYTLFPANKNGKISKVEIYGTLDRNIPKGGKVLQCKITNSTGTIDLGESATNNGAFTKGTSWLGVQFTTPVSVVNNTSYRLYCKVNNVYGGGSIYWLDNWQNRTDKTRKVYSCN